MTQTILFSSDLDDPVDWARAVAALRPELKIVDWREVDAPETVEFALLWKPPPGGLGPYKNLKGIQSLGAGVNQLDLAELPAGIPLARLIDTSLTETMVDYAVAATYRHFRAFDRYERETRARAWNYATPARKADFPVGVMGTGVLGGATAACLAGLGFPVAGWSRSRRAVPGVTAYAGLEELPAFLGSVKMVICVLPLTAQTAGILDARTFALLPKGAYVMNMGRGAHLIEADLVAAIEAGQIAGATLDVFSTEPLPQDHAIYGRPEILVTPHVAGGIAPQTAAATVIENYDRTLAGKPLLNAVDPARGY